MRDCSREVGDFVLLEIEFTEAQAATLKALAERRNISLAELVCEGVEHILKDDRREALWQQASSVIGRFVDCDGRTDVAENHDAYLDEAYL